MDTRRQVVIFLGGCAKIGGIETFAADLGTIFKGHPPTLLAWASSPEHLGRFDNLNIRVSATSFSKGCRFGLPDVILILRNLCTITRAKHLVLLKKPQGLAEHLARAILWRHRSVVYVTPYRPMEMWPGDLPTFFLKSVSRILTQSQQFKEDIVSRNYAGAIDVIPLLPPRPATSNGQFRTAGPMKIGFIGRLVDQKRPIYFLEIVRRLEQPIEAHVFGEGPLEAEMRAHAHTSGLDVRFHGAVDRSVIPIVIEQCDLFVISSKSEGQSIVALEVLAGGRPIASTGVGAIPEILRSGRFGIEIGLDDPSGAAQSIDALLKEIACGRWKPENIVADYCAAYDYHAIADAYRRVLS